MNFITEEIDRFIFVIRTRSVVWIEPLGFLLFALIMKGILNNIYDNYQTQHGSERSEYPSNSSLLFLSCLHGSEHTLTYTQS